MRTTRPRASVVVAIAVAAAWAAGTTGCKKDKPPTKPEPREYAKPAYTVPDVTDETRTFAFSDISTQAGIDFVHHTGAFGKKWMPETIGSGGGFLDYDNDGRADIFLVSGSDWPGHGGSTPQPTMKLYRNRGDGSFENVTVASGLDIVCYGMGCTFADYDDDGDTDIYVTAVGDNHLLRNDGQRFTDVTTGAGVSGNDTAPDSAPSWSTAATWIDYDRDGRLDLFVANYVRWTPETDIFTTLDGKNKSYATPQQYDGQSCRLYRNVDGTRFKDVTVRSGISNDDGKSLGVVAADFSGDGWIDLFVTNDTQPNFLYINQSDGTFVDTALVAGCGYDDTGRARAGMGVDVTDYNNDGVLSIAVGNFTDEPVSLYTQISDGLFQDNAGSARLTRPTLQPLTFGVLFADFDLDGHSDLVIANGHIEPEINTVRKEITFAQKPAVFRNNGAGAFVDVSTRAGAPFAEPMVARGLATADIDDDGDLDLLVTANGGPVKLLRNDSGRGNWVKIRLEGSGSNRSAIGATIVARSGKLTQRRFVRAGSGFLSQSDATVTLGLGEYPRVDAATVHWPDGTTQEVGQLNGGETHRIRQTP